VTRRSSQIAERRVNVGGSFARTGMPNALASASYNANNQLTQFGGASLIYDANGNLTSDGTNSYTWNARNQLVSISGGVAASFEYDARVSGFVLANPELMNGRRVSKTIGGTTQYVYDGANPVQEISGTTTSANLLTGGVDEYFQRTDTAGARNYLTDALGSMLALADSAGAIQNSYTYEPFGNTTVTGAPTTNSFAFTGRELDTPNLYFYRARYYSPNYDRFVSEDQLFPASGASAYSYAGNDPIGFADPFGLDKTGGVPRRAGVPTMRGVPRNCSLKARIFNATDFNFKEGLDLEAGIFNVGLSQKVNFVTNETTLEAEIGLLGSGFNAERVTDPGYLNQDLVDPYTEFSGHFGPIEHVFGGETKLNTSKVIRLGFAVGGGIDASFSWDKFKELTASCQEP